MGDRRLDNLNFTQLEKSELVGLKFELRPAQALHLFPDYAKGLHAWFLHQIQAHDPDLSRYLHDEQTEKAFALSRLDGPMGSQGDALSLRPDATYYWYLTLLSAEVIQGVLPWLQQLPNSLELARNLFTIEKVTTFLPAQTYGDLYQVKPCRTVTLSFLSPTSFRRKGNHFPLPVPNNLFHSYLRRWHEFSGYALDDDDDFLAWIDECVRIDRHWLESTVVPGGKRGNVTGFIGAIALSLSPKARENPEFSQLFHSLSHYAPYCGTGHKTPFGLGQTRCEWREPQQSCVAWVQSVLQEQSLAKRVEVLTELLMQRKKRIGGDRALKICQAQAQIVARRELGESLQTIAADLDLSYETARTYSKRAKKLLQGLS
jgi:CRISPR-associated endoribonuclease Cas6